MSEYLKNQLDNFSARLVQDKYTFIKVYDMQENEQFISDKDDLTVFWTYNGVSSVSLLDLSNESATRGVIFLLGNDFLSLSGAYNVELSRISESTRNIAFIIHTKEFLNALSLLNLYGINNMDIVNIIKDISQSSFIFHWPHSAKIIRCFEILMADFCLSYDMFDIILLDVARLLMQLSNIQDKDFVPLHSVKQTNTVMYILQYVRENFQTAELSKAAEILHYTPAYLSSLLNSNLGMSFNDLLDLRKTIVGRGLLLQTSKPLSDVAAELGFESYAGFYKFWKKTKKMSPRDYRQKYSKTNEKIDPVITDV